VHPGKPVGQLVHRGVGADRRAGEAEVRQLLAGAGRR
jgi:hypothetical protein